MTSCPDQRFYASSYGRFLTADPYVAGGPAKGSVSNPKDPGSWNRYGYVEGDPINNVDPTGQFMQNPCVIWGSLSWSCDPFGGLWGDPPNSFYPLSCTLNPSGCVEQLGVELGGAVGSETPTQAEWNALSSTCQQALQTAQPNTPVASLVAAFNNSIAAQSTLQSAVAGTSISWTMLAAIGIRESGFNGGPQVCPAGVTWGASNCDGYGVFQLTVSAATGITTAQAGNLTFAANSAAQILNSNMAILAANFPNFTPTQLLQATAASYNFGTGNISGNPNTIDWGTAPGGAAGNYGSNILGLMNCFN